MDGTGANNSAGQVRAQDIVKRVARRGLEILGIGERDNRLNRIVGRDNDVTLRRKIDGVKLRRARHIADRGHAAGEFTVMLAHGGGRCRCLRSRER